MTSCAYMSTMEMLGRRLRSVNTLEEAASQARWRYAWPATARRNT